MLDGPSTANPYVVLRIARGYITAYVHVGTGEGRARRRQLLHTVYWPHVPEDDLTDVLRGVAAQIALPPSERWRPRL